jgi:hypothetical protein
MTTAFDWSRLPSNADILAGGNARAPTAITPGPRRPGAIAATVSIVAVLAAAAVLFFGLRTTVPSPRLQANYAIEAPTPRPVPEHARDELRVWMQAQQSLRAVERDLTLNAGPASIVIDTAAAAPTPPPPLAPKPPALVVTEPPAAIARTEAPPPRLRSVSPTVQRLQTIERIPAPATVSMEPLPASPGATLAPTTVSANEGLVVNRVGPFSANTKEAAAASPILIP